jgi:hypothetical protein
MCQICDLAWHSSGASLMSHIWTHFQHRNPTAGELWFFDLKNCSVPANYPHES